jgi:hypothetical protein
VIDVRDHDHGDPALAANYDGTALVCDLCGKVIAGCTPLPPMPEQERKRRQDLRWRAAEHDVLVQLAYRGCEAHP